MLKEIQSILDCIKYKSNTWFQVHNAISKDAIEIVLNINVEERDLKYPIRIVNRCIIPNENLKVDNLEKFINDKVMHLVENLEVHEAREQYYYKGKRIFDPHAA